VLSGLLSFSTGGRVDSPTMAIIGDASKSRAGADTEWVFRDDQINALLYRVANEFNKSLFSLVGNLRDDNTYLASLLQENLELSKYAITPQGNVIDTQSDIIALTLASVLNTSIKELDTKLGTIANYQTKLNEQSQDITIDYNVFREEFSILKSELLNKESNSQVSNDLLKVVNVINNDNVIATIDEMKSEVVNELQIINSSIQHLEQTVAGLELSISQNDIYKANRSVEINRNLRSRT
jgi:prefoldin subunit 5